MKRALIAGFAWLLAGTAMAQAQAPAGALADEARFLSAAADAAKNGDRDGTVQLYQSAIVYAPSDPIPYQRLAQFFAQNGELELAHRYFGLALDVQPAYAPALAGLAMLDIAAGDRASAQTQHNILLHSCGAACPETAQVEKALNGVLDTSAKGK